MLNQQSLLIYLDVRIVRSRRVLRWNLILTGLLWRNWKCTVLWKESKHIGFVDMIARLRFSSEYKSQYVCLRFLSLCIPSFGVNMLSLSSSKQNVMQDFSIVVWGTGMFLLIYNLSHNWNNASFAIFACSFNFFSRCRHASSSAPIHFSSARDEYKIYLWLY
jgi:hypothetical protein